MTCTVVTLITVQTYYAIYYYRQVLFVAVLTWRQCVSPF